MASTKNADTSFERQKIGDSENIIIYKKSRRNNKMNKSEQFFYKRQTLQGPV
jgi:hypothetical protein